MSDAAIPGEAASVATVQVILDLEPVVVPRHTTPNEILSKGGVAPATNYLVKINNDHTRESFEGRGTDPITVHEGERFASISTGPTTTS